MQSNVEFRVVHPSHQDQGLLWFHEALLQPPIYDEAMRLIQRFFNAIREAPHAFRGSVYKAVLILDRAIARLGAKLEQLGTNRQKIFRDAHKMIQIA